MYSNTNGGGRIRTILGIVGFFLLPAIWVMVKAAFKIPDLYLPSLRSVLDASLALEPNFAIHVVTTTVRLTIGFTAGTILGLSLGLVLSNSQIAGYLLSPSIHALRSVPSAAAVPFFLMWFGFGEIGRYLIVLSAVGLNVAVASQQILSEHSRSHLTFFLSYEIPPGSLPLRYSLPRVLEEILPTLRYSLSLSIGAVTVSELLGAQVGLGYLLQTGRSTFSFSLVFLSIIAIGAISSCFDLLLRLFGENLYIGNPYENRLYRSAGICSFYNSDRRCYL